MNILVYIQHIVKRHLLNLPKIWYTGFRNAEAEEGASMESAALLYEADIARSAGWLSYAQGARNDKHQDLTVDPLG